MPAARIGRVSRRPCRRRSCFSASLGERKGVPVLIAAPAAWPASGLDWRAVIAGDGDAAPYRAEVERLGLSARVSFRAGWARRRAHEHLCARRPAGAAFGSGRPADGGGRGLRLGRAGDLDAGRIDAWISCMTASKALVIPVAMRTRLPSPAASARRCGPAPTARRQCARLLRAASRFRTLPGKPRRLLARGDAETLGRPSAAGSSTGSGERKMKRRPRARWRFAAAGATPLILRARLSASARPAAVGASPGWRSPGRLGDRGVVQQQDAAFEIAAFHQPRGRSAQAWRISASGRACRRSDSRRWRGSTRRTGRSDGSGASPDGSPHRGRPGIVGQAQQIGGGRRAMLGQQLRCAPSPARRRPPAPRRRAGGPSRGRRPMCAGPGRRSVRMLLHPHAAAEEGRLRPGLRERGDQIAACWRGPARHRVMAMVPLPLPVSSMRRMTGDHCPRETRNGDQGSASALVASAPARRHAALRSPRAAR